MWVARDKDNSLWLFKFKPYKQNDIWECVDGEDNLSVEYQMEIDKDLFPKLKWKDEPIEVIITSKEDLIKRFEILNTMYQNTNPDNINDCSFKEYALKNWDNIDMNYFNKIG